MESMSAFAVAAITFACTFGGAMIANVVRTRLPPPHMSRETQDVVRLGMGLVATMTALLLGLVTAAAKGSFDSQDVAVRNAAAGIVTLDRLLARYGPEAGPIRGQLRDLVAARVEATWPLSGAPRGLDDLQGVAPAEEIENRILALSPENDTQRWLKSQALQLTQEVLRTRSRLSGGADGSVPQVFLIVVVFWLTMTFASIEMARAFVQAPVGEPQTLPLVAMAMVAAASAALWYGLGRALRAGPAIAAVEPPPAGAGESVDMRPAAAPGGARRVA